MSALAVLAPATTATAASSPDPTTWQSDAKAPDPGPALACAGGAGTVTPAVGAAETEYGGIGSASDDHDVSYVRVALSTAAPDGCAPAGGTHAQIEVIPSIDLTTSHPALCAVGTADAQPCAVTTRPGELGGVIVEDDRSGTPAPWAVGAPGAPLYVELPYDQANGTFGQEPEHRCAPAGPCSPEAAGYRAQLAVRYLPGMGGTPSAPILTTVGLHADPRVDQDGAGTGPATDDGSSWLYAPLPSQVSRPSLRRGWTVHVRAKKGQTGKVEVTVGLHLIATGSAKARKTGKLSIKVKLTRSGPKHLAKRDAYLVIKLTGHVAQGAPIRLYGSAKAKAAGAPIAKAPVCENSYLYFIPPAARADFRAALLCLLNGARKAQGLPALRRAAPLETVGQSQSDKFAATGSGSHGKSLTDITKRFAKKGYKAAAYNEGFAVLDAGASPYAFLADMVKRAGVPCTEIFDPRFRDIGIGVSAGGGGSVTTLALELGRRVGTSQPSSKTKAAATCGHKVPAPVVEGPVIDGRGDPTSGATSVTASLACVAKAPCVFTAAASLPDAGATSPAQQLTIAAGKTMDVVFPFDAAALTAARSAAQPKVAIALAVSAPAQYADTLTAPLPAAASASASAAAAPPSREDAARRLAAARARWKKAAIKSYTYRILVSCGCSLPEGTVTVRGGKATTKPATGYGDYKTVNRLFSLIKRYLADKPYAFQATYDKTTGVPINISVHQDKLGVDDYYGFGTRAFKKLG
ncbi:MAG: hypothetical protein JWR63_2280 [Conexibacter sp.]|nr:hypothetical protein [Conexibacter sp.]